MSFVIRMGVPEMAELWSRLQKNYRKDNLGKDDLNLYKKWGQALKHLSQNPTYPGLHSHEISDLSKRYGIVRKNYINYIKLY